MRIGLVALALGLVACQAAPSPEPVVDASTEVDFVGDVRGRLIDASGNPAAGEIVWFIRSLLDTVRDGDRELDWPKRPPRWGAWPGVWGETDKWRLAQTTTDSDGRFRFDGTASAHGWVHWVGGPGLLTHELVDERRVFELVQPESFQVELQVLGEEVIADRAPFACAVPSSIIFANSDPWHWGTGLSYFLNPLQTVDLSGDGVHADRFYAPWDAAADSSSPVASLGPFDRSRSAAIAILAFSEARPWSVLAYFKAAPSARVRRFTVDLGAQGMVRDELGREVEQYDYWLAFDGVERD